MHSLQMISNSSLEVSLNMLSAQWGERSVCVRYLLVCWMWDLPLTWLSVSDKVQYYVRHWIVSELNNFFNTFNSQHSAASVETYWLFFPVNSVDQTQRQVTPASKNILQIKFRMLTTNGKLLGKNVSYLYIDGMNIIFLVIESLVLAMNIFCK